MATDRMAMQYYAPHTIQNGRQHPEYAYPPGHVTSPRMQWHGHPGMWGYDFAAAYPGGYPVNVDPQRSPSYHIASPTVSEAAQGTPHNIRDILGGQQQQQHTQPSEGAKTPSSYQKSPTSAAAVFSPEHMRSPTTPNAPVPPMQYTADPHSFYMPAMPRMPVGYEGAPGEMHPPGLICIPPHSTSALTGKPADGDKISKDGKKEKKGRATFSGMQIEELEKAFNATQYLTTAERARLADRLSLSESQVKIWFQNRRTKCRRTSWKQKN